MTAASVLALTLQLLVAPHPARELALAGAPGSERRVIDLDLTGLEPIDPGVRAELAQAIHDALARPLAAHSVSPTAIHVDVRWHDHDDLDYAVRLHVDAHDTAVAFDRTLTSGPDATASALGEMIAANLERALAERAPGAVAPADKPAVTVRPTVDAPPPARTRSRSLGRLGWTGVGLAIAGAAGVGTGVALVVIGFTPDSHYAFALRDWHPAGYALLGLGGSAIVAGSVMAIVGARRSQRRIALAPTKLPRGAGVTVRVRF
jgi:hypothetical protein